VNQSVAEHELSSDATIHFRLAFLDGFVGRSGIVASEVTGLLQRLDPRIRTQQAIVG
jgi:hypothetical protein